MSDMIPTPRELEALKVLWSEGPSTVREIYRKLGPEHGDLAYTTILSLMQTMERKGLVGREETGKGKTHRYFARARNERTLRQLAGTFLDTVFDGAMSQYLVRALEARRPSLEELEEMERMVAEAKARAREKDKDKDKGRDRDKEGAR